MHPYPRTITRVVCTRARMILVCKYNDVGWGDDASLSDAPRLRQSNRDRLRVMGHSSERLVE